MALLNSRSSKLHEFGISVSTIIMSSCYITFVRVDGLGCQVWEFLLSQLISLFFSQEQDMIKATDKFLRNTVFL